MFLRLIKLDKVALFGTLVGMGSLFTLWLTLRPNRLAVGNGINLWGSFGMVASAALFVLWLVCFVLSVIGGKRRFVLLGVTAAALIIFTLIMIGAGARSLLEGKPEIMRVSIGGGVWLTLGGAYAVMYAARQGLRGQGGLREIITWAPLLALAVLLGAGWLDRISILQEFAGNRQRFFQELAHHIELFGASVLAAIIIGVPLGVWASRSRAMEKPVFYVTSIMQTVPSLALFGILMAPLAALSFAYPWLRDLGVRGVGVAPAVIALTIYSLLPVVRNTYVGIRQVNAAAVDAGRGMGMSRWQIFRRVEAPLAAPLALEGIRTASVQAVGLTAVAALIGAGGLGFFIFQGIGQAAYDLIILGALPIVALALLVDGVMRAAVRLGTPRGLRA